MSERRVQRGSNKRTAPRLTADDWTSAALDAMAGGGLAADRHRYIDQVVRLLTTAEHADR